jgi:hypothetical protein
MIRHSRQSPAWAGIQFVIDMADSKSYGVREARKIATGTTESSCVTIAIWRICYDAADDRHRVFARRK